MTRSKLGSPLAFSFILGCIMLLLVVSAQAQITSLDSTTSPPVPGVGHDYIKMLGETVNPTNGSVSLRIDIPTPRGRGLDIPFSILYSSSGVEHVIGAANGGGGWATDTGQQSGSGWTYSVPTLTTIQGIASQYNPGPPPVTYSCYYYYSYIMRDWTGAAHQLGGMTAAQNPNDGNTGCSQSTNRPSSNLAGSDGVFQGITTVPTSPTIPNPVTVADPDGTVYKFSPSANILNANNVVSFWATASSVEDRNGNVVRAAFSNGTNGISGTVTDTLNRTVVSVSPATSSTNTVSVSGQSGSYTQNWLSVPVNFSVTSTPTGNNPCTGIGVGAAQASNNVVQTLALPNGKSYQFQYDSTYGLLNKITYPSGGYVSYIWGLNPQSEIAVLPAPPNFSVSSCPTIYDSPAIIWRFVSYDGVHIAEQQSFSYKTTWNGPNYNWDSKQTTVTTYDLVRNSSYQTVYRYAPYYGFPGEQSVTYQDFSGAVLKTVTKAWINQLLLGCEVETLDNGSNSGAWYSYGSGNQMTDKKEYDYGLIGSPAACQGSYNGVVSSPPSGVTPTRETATAYQGFSSTPIFSSSSSIFDRPSTLKVYGNGTLMAETDYAYDGSSVSSVSATQHDDATYGTSYNNRGNATTTTNKCLQTGCSNVIATYKYDETGQVTSITDPCGNGTCSDVTGTGHTTTYSYANNFTLLSGGQNVNYSPSGNTNAYLTQITDPLGHTANFTYDYSNGQLTASKDANSRSTTYVYNDVFARPTKYAYPDGGQTTFSYNDTAPSPTATTTKLISTSNISSTSTAVMDGLGHIVQMQLTSDPDGADYVDIAYDGIGRVKARSNPHRGSASTTDGTTNYVYDALGRTTEVDQPDGSDVETKNAGNCTTVNDETGTARKSCSDAMGRLTEVDEPGTGASVATGATGTVTLTGSVESSTTSATSGSGSVTIGGNEQSKTIYPCGYSFCPQLIWDSGDMSITVNGFTAHAYYGQNTDVNWVTSTLASGLNSSSSPVTATINGTVITMTAKTAGAATNYSFSSSGVTYQPSYFSPSFWGSPTSSTLTGGRDAGAFYDSGTVSITVNGFTSSASYSHALASTTTSIASDLTNGFSASGSPVTASASGSTITLSEAGDPGSDSNFTLSTSTTWDTRDFVRASFEASRSGTTLNGGTDGSLGSSPLVTLYTYDALSNLTCAVQKGTDTTAFTSCASAPATWRPRSFVYDSLSRLTIVSNPESGTISYTYDANGNLSTKVAPKPNPNATGTVTTTYSYDVLNRITQKSYTGMVGPTSLYAYDGANLSGCPGPAAPTITSPTNLVGRRSSMCTTKSASSWSYDSIGRPVTEARTNQGSSSKTYNVGYLYNLDGSLAQLWYPSGKYVVYTVGGAGRVIQADANLTTLTTVATASYTPSGSLAGGAEGPTAINNIYNSRLQPILLSNSLSNGQPIFSVCYDFHLHQAINNAPCSFGSYTTGDNGNVFQIINNIDSTRSTAFVYDFLNRLSQSNTITTAGPNCWGETYTIDAWGNLTNRAGVSGMGSCYTEILNAAPASPKNQLNGIFYDAAGNVTNDGNGNMPTYDSENQIATDNGVTYSYDADGFRMEKSPGNMYWPGPGGEVLAETDLSGNINAEYVYFNGSRLARIDRPSGTVHYYFSDHLGSASAITDASGNVQQKYYYYPYGGMQSSTGSDPNHYKFTGKEHDTESNLDYFGARHYSSMIGRFMTVDPSRLSAFIEDPQSWNRYSYVHNSPLRLVDKNGKWPTDIHNQIIDLAFPNLTPDQRQILKNVSAQQDNILTGGQANSTAYQHALSSPGQTAAEAAQKFSDFVSGSEADAQTIQIQFWLSDPDSALDNQLSDSALAAFGLALHDMVDSTSPAHAGFQLWNWKNFHDSLYAHERRESSITRPQLINAANVARNAFNATFGVFGNPFILLELQMNQEEQRKPRKACVTAAGDTTCEIY
jgi:RHS repeat-associated protein